MSHAQCILCFKLICSNSSDRNYVRGKSNIQVELEDLTFVVTESSDYICQKCVSLVKKRRTLKNKLAEIDESLLLQYRKGAKENGIPCKLRNASKRLNFLPSDQEIVENASTYADRPAIQQANCSPLTCLPFDLVPIHSSTPQTSKPILTQSRQNIGEMYCTGPSKETKVTVRVQWPSGNKEKIVSDDVVSLGKMLCRGTCKQIAHAAWKSKVLRPHILKEMSKEVNRECSKLCSKKSPSCLRLNDPDNISKFSLEKVNDELKERAPVFHLLLRSGSFSPRKKQSYGSKRWLNAVGVSAAVCLNHRSQNLYAFQLTLSIILQHSGFMVM